MKKHDFPQFVHTHDMLNVSELANTTFEILQDRFDGFEQSSTVQSLFSSSAQPSKLHII